jgi:hypothetical protein
MPVAYQIDHTQSLIHTKCVGNINLEEVLGHFAELEVDEGDALDLQEGTPRRVEEKNPIERCTSATKSAS